ncbi:hypothetical protein MalM25_20150 [Planctomycetes bacterium MalM25]|nr:hypothetical protein MalM25_20150 [Planctomycetes bacterium MalM25]
MASLDRPGLVLRILLGIAVAPTLTVAAPPTDDAFLDEVERRTFNYFWETTPAENGLTPDRWPGESASSIAAVGFGLTACCLGAKRGWITRDAAAERVLTTLRFLHQSPQNKHPVEASGFRGFYYHFLKMDSGTRWRKCELSSIDTALLMLGVLSCREFFDHEDESEIRELAEALYRRVEWDWMQPRPPRIAMGWKPEGAGAGPRAGFGGNDYRGYNEAIFLYLLALGSPTYPIEPDAWDAFTESYDWSDFQGREHVNFSPLFGHQYAACWIDLKGIQDDYMRSKGIDYFENSRRATLAQRDYAISNPHGWSGYGKDIWGLTACDGPGPHDAVVGGVLRRFSSYRARGASARRIDDDGTIAPTAAGGSIPFAPEESIAALRTMKRRYGDQLYGPYGFRDAFNPTFTFADIKTRHGGVSQDGWFDNEYLGIDQGPILLMAENYRSGFVWELMRSNPYLRQGLRRAGFRGGWLDNPSDNPDE